MKRIIIYNIEIYHAITVNNILSHPHTISSLMLLAHSFSDQTCYDLVRRNRMMGEYTVTNSNHPNSAPERYHIMRVNHNLYHHSKECLRICFDCSRRSTLLKYM